MPNKPSNTLKTILEIPDEAAMLRFGEACAHEVGDALRIYLSGELGAGKTTWVRGFLRGLGYTGRVKSPTYTLVEPYHIGDRTVYHFDLYRIAVPTELEFIGMHDYLQEKAICIIEWPERGGEFLPEADWYMNMRVSGVGREIEWIK